MNTDGSNRRNLIRGSGPVWKPDGKQLSYSSRRNIIVLKDIHDETGRELVPEHRSGCPLPRRIESSMARIGRPTENGSP
jgi:hypothetical protein